MIKLNRSKFGNWPSGPRSRLKHPTLFMPGFMGGGGGALAYQITNSLRFRASNSAYLSRTWGTPTNNNIWTVCISFKAGQLGTNRPLFGSWGSASLTTQCYLDTSDRLRFFVSDASGVTKIDYVTNRVFRDLAAHYTLTLGFDNSLVTTLVSMEINLDAAESSFATSTNSAVQNSNYSWNKSGLTHYIGTAPNTSGTLFAYFDGVISHPIVVDGQKLAASNFLQIDAASGQPVPKRYSGTYGAQGSICEFKDASAATAAAIGKDTSGNGNNWTPTGISVTAGVTFDQLTDTPTNNYAVLAANNIYNGPTLAAGMDISSSTSSVRNAAAAAAITQKTYFEGTATFAATSGKTMLFGVGSKAFIGDYSANLDSDASAWIGMVSGTLRYTGNGSSTNRGSAGTNDVIQFAVDPPNGKLWIGFNNTWVGGGDPAADTSPTFTGLPSTLYALASAYNATGSINFGQRAFSYTPPTGFKALCTANLPTPSIPRSEDAFAVILRAGSASPVSVTGLRFAPDLVWIKSRSTADNHNLADTTRGTAKNLVSNSANAEDSVSRVTAFNADGYSLAGGAGATNAAGQNFVDWAWRKGAAYGFDIVAYAGTGAAQNPAHSLGVAPHMMIVKARGVAANPDWFVYHRSISTPQSNRLFLNSASAVSASSAWNNTAPTSSVFTVNTDLSQSGINYIAHLWTEIPGFSLFGSYTGNGSSDGPFVWCGFRPRFLMVKNASAGSTVWLMFDAARDTYNVMNKNLYAEQAVAEDTANVRFDFTSNGFKVRNSNASENGSGNTIIFAAFAEAPFKYATAR